MHTNPEELLRAAGLRATPGRIELIQLLAAESAPLSVHQIERRLKGALNQVTLYRALESLAHAGIVARINLEHDHAHYELVAGREHHHHAVCKHCGFIEDIQIPHPRFTAQTLTKHTTQFAHLDRYSLEFFGLCKKCAH